MTVDNILHPSFCLKVVALSMDCVLVGTSLPLTTSTGRVVQEPHHPLGQVLLLDTEVTVSLLSMPFIS